HLLPCTLRAGEFVPLLPAEAVLVFVLTSNAAPIASLAPSPTLFRSEIAPCDTPSTSTSAMVWQASGEIVKLWFAPQFTDTLPEGEIGAQLPAAATSGYGMTSNDATIVWFAVTLLKV